MARKPLIYTDLFPYHINARANNREWFYLPIEQCWSIFTYNLFEISNKYGFQIHSFVLMNNHYHLIGSAHPQHNIGEVMAWFQKSVSRTIGYYSDRINHVFGGPYRASLIQTPAHYAQVYKYLARNPVRAGIVQNVEDYRFMCIEKGKLFRNGSDLIVKPGNGIDHVVEEMQSEKYKWLNVGYEFNTEDIIRKGLKKSIYLPRDMVSRNDLISF